jgi:hypothetical protein
MQQKFFNEDCTEQTHEATLLELNVGSNYFVILFIKIYIIEDFGSMAFFESY